MRYKQSLKSSQGSNYRYQSRRSFKRLARRSRRNFIITIVITGALIYASITWILPNFIGGVGFAKNIIQPSRKIATTLSGNSTLAPPVLNIPYEATSTAEISISGFGTPDSKVILFLDDEKKQTSGVSSEGSFTFNSIALNLGTNNIYATSVDDQNLQSLPSKNITVIYDNEKPALEISEPEDGKTIQGGEKKIRIAGKTDPGIKVFANDTQVIIARDGNFSIDLPLNEGDNIISIKAVDDAGNSAEMQRKVTYKAETPS